MYDLIKLYNYIIMRKITIKPNVTIYNFCLANKQSQGKNKTLQIVLKKKNNNAQQQQEINIYKNISTFKQKFKNVRSLKKDEFKIQEHWGEGTASGTDTKEETNNHVSKKTETFLKKNNILVLVGFGLVVCN